MKQAPERQSPNVICCTSHSFLLYYLSPHSVIIDATHLGGHLAQPTALCVARGLYLYKIYILSRTMNTSLTTLVTMLAIAIFGGEAIRGLAVALILGVIIGTYASIFIATPIMYDLTKKADSLLSPG